MSSLLLQGGLYSGEEEGVAPPVVVASALSFSTRSFIASCLALFLFSDSLALPLKRTPRLPPVSLCGSLIACAAGVLIRVTAAANPTPRRCLRLCFGTIAVALCRDSLAIVADPVWTAVIVRADTASTILQDGSGDLSTTEIST
eukprot:CAMPEP_0206135250 /NCGR_PEP_ID=MMETSP1473-20131121/583_1 /ASSEMBLY_ACC=CAM_ASM_001109 /TAXON_ID=1461547 /ORGANISM="Stichococcus sp, Strain RCC1054" /LENGTH=143 /DNA_ID=CAMNT_0053527045 /DNA_START=923 /DNA_END=1354 /DNA_ORIENTATION=+